MKKQTHDNLYLLDPIEIKILESVQPAISRIKSEEMMSKVMGKEVESQSLDIGMLLICIADLISKSRTLADKNGDQVAELNAAMIEVWMVAARRALI